MMKQRLLNEDAAAVLEGVGFEPFCGSTVFITGGTGLIGQLLVRAFLKYNKEHNGSVRLVLAVRNREKAERLFPGNQEITYITSDIRELKPEDMGIDYVIHCASPTSSRDFVQRPLETILTAVEGTRNVLEFARLNNVRSMVFLSTMEVYGTPSDDHKITEESGTDLNTMAVRSSYPESKRLCEAMCAAYCSEYGVPVKVLRLTQTFGPGVSYDDGRVFAEMSRCAIERKNIVLKTKGDTKRSYLYLADAVTAILTVLLKGRDQEAYNAANESTYCSILEMAQMVAEDVCSGEIGVVIEADGQSAALGYAPVLHMNLSVRKLMDLGWRPTLDLPDMFRKTIQYMQADRDEEDQS